MSMKRTSAWLIFWLLASGVGAFGQVDFEKEVWPILQERCLDCHKAPFEQNGRLKNPKAGLRLDGAAHFLRGSDDGKVIKPNHPSESLLYQLITLPEDDDDRMPPKGDLLTEERQEIFRKWIAQGVDFGTWEGATDGTENFGQEEKDKETYVPAHLTAYDQLAKGLKPLPEKTLQDVAESTGALVRPIGIGNPLLEVRFVAESVASGDDDLAKLGPLRQHLAKLDLRRSQVTSDGLAALSKFPKLTRLDLRDTRVGDDDLDKLADLRHLAFLNLSGTKVSDAGLRKLARCQSLRQVRLWNSSATKQGAEQLVDKLKDADVSL